MEQNKVNPMEEMQRDVDSAKRDFSSLITKASLNSVKEEFSNLDTKIANIGLRIQKIRDRKYAFNKIVEQQGDEYKKQWSLKKLSIQSQIMREASNLQASIRPP